MNYVLIFPDEMRAESLGCYGHPFIKTPNIDRLAQEGTRFAANYTAHPVCGPSRSCLATGWYPHVDGRRTFYMPDDHTDNMFSHLKDAGFTLCHVGKDDMFDHASMEKIFHYFYPFCRRDAMKSCKVISQARYSMIYEPVPDEKEAEIGDAVHNQQAISFIREHAHDEKPFFMMISYMFPHPPYGGPERFYHMYDNEDISLRTLEWMEGKPEYYPILRKYREMEDKDPTLFKKMNAVYLGMISYVDMLTGQIMDALKENGIYDDTTVIFCSDHGDFAGDAGQTEKWPSDMSDMITKVPLIIRRPHAPAGQVIETPTQSIDILPTVCDFEQVKLHYAQFGVSLKPQIEGKPGDSERAAYTEGGYDTWEPWCFEPTCFEGTYLEHPMPEGTDYYPKVTQQQEVPDSVCRVIMQRYQNWKLVVRTNGQNELYDLEKDPQEYHNLYGRSEFKQIQQKLQDKMLTWLISRSDVVPIEGRG